MSKIPTREEREAPKPIGWLYKRLVNKHMTGPPLDGQIQMDGVWGTPSTQLNFTPTLPTERWIYWQSPVYLADAIDRLEKRLVATEENSARQLLLLKGLVNYRASYMPSISPVISETLAVLDDARKEGKW